MKIARHLNIPQDKEKAIALQKEYAKEVIIKSYLDAKIIAGTDVSYVEKKNEAYVAIVVIHRETLEILEECTWVGEIPCLYYPGLFSLREAPCLLNAFEKLQTIPDAILIDGNGLIHPRRFGLACEIGLSLEIPTIGCAKKLFLGKHGKMGRNKGHRSPILQNEEILGMALRTKLNKTPIYVSVGHRFDLDSACELVLSVSKEDRDPVPLLHAHNMTVTLREKYKK